MDPITFAITNAIAAGVLSSTTTVAKQIIIDLYAELKELLKHKYGSESTLIEAVNNLENNQDSIELKKIIEEEITAVEANKDPELINKAQTLLKQLNIQYNEEYNSQVAHGNNIYQANNNSQISINQSQPKKKGHGR